MKDNHFISSFGFNRLRKARKGQAGVDVTFKIDVNGILEVMAKDPSTQRV